jgi:hypothetical protein
MGETHTPSLTVDDVDVMQNASFTPHPPSSGLSSSVEGVGVKDARAIIISENVNRVGQARTAVPSNDNPSPYPLHYGG